MKLRNIILIIALLLPFASGIILGLNGGGWFYLATIAMCIATLIVFEIISVAVRKKTISKDIAESPKWVFWTVTGSFICLGIGMAVHWLLY